jgi:diguanylate cyclase (GGDEF)-like protein
MPDSHRLQSLLDQSAELVSSGRPLSVLFEQVCALLASHFDVNTLFVALVQSDGTTRVEYALDHGIRRYPGLAVDERSTTAAIMRDGRTVLRSISSDWLAYPRAPIRAEDPTADDSVSGVFAPIVSGKRTIGVLSVQSPRENAFDVDDVEVIELIAADLSSAIQRQRPSLHGERRTARAYTWTIVAALIGLTIAIAAAITVATNESQTRARVNQTARSTMIQHALGEVIDEAGELATNASLLVPMVPKTQSAIEALAQHLLDAAPGTSIDGVGIWYQPFSFDPKRKYVAAYATRRKLGRHGNHIAHSYVRAADNYFHQVFYAKGLHAGSVQFNPPYSEGGDVFLGAVAPIRDRTGKTIGVASSDVYGGDFARVLGLTTLPRYEFAYVLSSDGRIVAMTDETLFRRSISAPAKTATHDIEPHALVRCLLTRIGNDTTESRVRVESGLVVHLVADNAGLFAQASGLRGAALVVIGIIWVLGGVMIAIDLRRHRGGRRAQNLELEKIELENEIAERQRAEERLRRFAFFDALTDLPNRAFLFEHLTRALDRSQTKRDRFAVLYIDLDRFKIVNDSLGHAVGDELLVAVARRLESSIHADDIIARIGGDEFVIILHHLEDGEYARRVAHRIIERMGESFDVRGSDIYTGASIGIIADAGGYASPSDLLRDADVAMYEAKGQGKDRYVLFDRDLHMRTVAQLRLETDLRGAVDRSEFVLRYQPIVDLSSGRLAGFEALVRWQHPERGLLGPGEFISISEQNRTVIRLGTWVVREAVREFCTWGRSDLTIAVNVSVRQIVQANFVAEIAGLLVTAGMDARALKIEITESALMEDVETSARALRELRDIGVQAHIDDFGTGYSSLSYLRRFAIESIKIDRSFVAEMTQRPEAFEIVRTIVTLASTLGLTVTAEGIETAEQLASCRSLGITYGQGYYLSYPLEPIEAGENAKRSLPASFAR